MVNGLHFMLFHVVRWGWGWLDGTEPSVGCRLTSSWEMVLLILENYCFCICFIRICSFKRRISGWLRIFKSRRSMAFPESSGPRRVSSSLFEVTGRLLSPGKFYPSRWSFGRLLHSKDLTVWLISCQESIITESAEEALKLHLRIIQRPCQNHGHRGTVHSRHTMTNNTTLYRLFH